tara:strand:- start:2360 stop:2788 length:429 start_codon:yes stop_codon:yes gene_type:complete
MDQIKMANSMATHLMTMVLGREPGTLPRSVGELICAVVEMGPDVAATFIACLTHRITLLTSYMAQHHPETKDSLNKLLEEIKEENMNGKFRKFERKSQTTLDDFDEESLKKIKETTANNIKKLKEDFDFDDDDEYSRGDKFN